MLENLFWCIAGIIGGAISSFSISLFFYLKGFKNKKILYSEIHTIKLSKSSILRKTLLSGTAQIWNAYYRKKGDFDSAWAFRSNISSGFYDVEYFRIKITGKEVINMNDFANSSPFGIQFSTDYSPKPSSDTVIMKSSNPHNPLRAVFEDNSMFINFDYLSKGEELWIYILHRRGSSRVNGVLKSGQLSSIGSSFILYITKLLIKIILIPSLILFILYCILNYLYLPFP